MLRSPAWLPGAEQTVQFSVHEVPPLGWERFGSLDGYAPRLHGAVVRLLWLALNPQAGFSRLPHGWARNRFALPVTLACGEREAEIRLALENLFWRKAEEFASWLLASVEADLPAFEKAAMLADLEEIENFAASYGNDRTSGSRLALL